MRGVRKRTSSNVTLNSAEIFHRVYANSTASTAASTVWRRAMLNSADGAVEFQWLKDALLRSVYPNAYASAD